jgi:hypothetical protein
VEDLGFDLLLAYDHVLGAVHADRARPLPGPSARIARGRCQIKVQEVHT